MMGIFLHYLLISQPVMNLEEKIQACRRWVSVRAYSLVQIQIKMQIYEEKYCFSLV